MCYYVDQVFWFYFVVKRREEKKKEVHVSFGCSDLFPPWKAKKEKERESPVCMQNTFIVFVQLDDNDDWKCH